MNPKLTGFTVQEENGDNELVGFGQQVKVSDTGERLRNLLRGKKILIFGGTGSWGRELGRIALTAVTIR